MTGAVARAVAEARALLADAVVTWRGEPVGLLAVPASDRAAAENYYHCFVRDVVPAALLELPEGRSGMVRAFLLVLAQLQAARASPAGHRRAPGLMPASFAVERGPDGGERLRADSGD